MTTPEGRRRIKAGLYRRQNGTCLYCFRRMRLRGVHFPSCTFPDPDDEATLEHLTPRSRGGSGRQRNLALVCRRCNGERGNVDLAVWVQTLPPPVALSVLEFTRAPHVRMLACRHDSL